MSVASYQCSPMIKANIDGASSKILAGTGIVFRDHTNAFLLVAYKNIGKKDSFLAECTAIVTAMELAIQQGWKHLWIETDSEAALNSFVHLFPPWQLRYRWTRGLQFFSSILLSSVWREANFTADRVSKKALKFTNQDLHTFNVASNTLQRLCQQEVKNLQVNGSLPGPVNKFCEGDKLIVHVNNKSPYNMPIHWHGVFQMFSGWADGPALK